MATLNPTPDIPLPNLSVELLALTGDRGPGYRKLLELALDGVIPTVQRKNRRYVAEADLPAIAAALGLTPTAASQVRGRVGAYAEP